MNKLATYLGVTGGLAALAFVGWRTCSPTEQWKRMRTVDLDVIIVDYTVPFESYKEHLGIVWMLGHRKVRPPGGAPSWRADEHYVGYRPTDRDHPVRIADIDTSSADVIYIADTYGVYRDDLLHVAEQRAHMDYNPVVFGGLSAGDALALEAFTRRGGTLIAEFNTLCEPTDEAVRARMEALLGVTWSGWVGRVFIDPHDRSDVPYWLPREFARQYPDRELPRAPSLVLVDRHGRLEVFSAESVAAISPRVVMTESGRARFPRATANVPYYYWFALMRERPGAEVHARMTLPERADLRALLDEIGVPPMPAMLTEREDGQHIIQLSGEFGDLDFDPGDHASAGVIERHARNPAYLDGITSAPVFWRFFAPIMDQVLAELERRP